MLSTLKTSCQLMVFIFWLLQITFGAFVDGLNLFGRQSVDQGIVGGLVIGINQACPANATKCDSSELENLRSICCPSLTTYCYRKTINNETWPYCCLNGMDCSKVGAVDEVCGDPDWIPCFTSSQYKCCEPSQVCTYDFGEGCYDTLPTVSTASLLSYTSRPTSSTRSSSSTQTTINTTTTPSTSATPAAQATGKGGLSSAAVGGIAGGVVGGVILVAVALGVGICVGRRRRRKANNLLGSNSDVAVAQTYQPPYYDPYLARPPGSTSMDASYAPQPAVISELASKPPDYRTAPQEISELG